MSDPKLIKEIMDSVTIPVMAKARIGHKMECRVRYEPLMWPEEWFTDAIQALEVLEVGGKKGVDFIDESEVLTPADNHHVNKHEFKVPFVCGCRDLGEALRRIKEGAAMSMLSALWPELDYLTSLSVSPYQG